MTSRPTDPRAVMRVFDDLLWVIRREGIVVSTSQALDAMRALQLVGLDEPARVREALALVIVQRTRDRARFDRAFEAFFSRSTWRRSLWERLEARGLSAQETEVLRELLTQLGQSSVDGGIAAVLERGAEFDRLLHLAGTSRSLDGLKSPLQVGFFSHRVFDRIGGARAHDALRALRALLVDALGHERATIVSDAVQAELELSRGQVRDYVESTLEKKTEPRDASDRLAMPIDSLDEAELDEVRRAVRRLVERLRGGERVRRRKARHGRIDMRRTVRLAARTDGVPYELSRRSRRRDKPKLVIVCDVSESVRSVARFLLEFAYAAQELFSKTRTFVFVSELGETTHLFAECSVDEALAKAYSGAVVPVTHNSNYGRALRAFESVVLPDIDRRTTVVIVGDGRTNYLEPAASVLDAVRARARALVWLCPEPRSAWATGDSAMPTYAPKCTNVLEARSARDLEDAARLIGRLR